MQNASKNKHILPARTYELAFNLVTEKAILVYKVDNIYSIHGI